MKLTLLAFGLLVIFGLPFLLNGVKVHCQSIQCFTCGSTFLCEQDAVSGSQVTEGSEYAVIVSVSNQGGTDGTFSTNFAFRDPNGVIVDGSRGPTIYHLSPGQTIILDWHHAFGCTGRPKGEYVLGIGTSVIGVSVPCNNYSMEGGIGYHEMVLSNETICPGFQP